MRWKKLLLFWICAERTAFILSMREKKPYLFGVCAVRNYVWFEYAPKETIVCLLWVCREQKNDTFSENTRVALYMLHINMHGRSPSYTGVCIEWHLLHTEHAPKGIVLMLSTGWEYGERCFMREMRFSSLFWVCAGIDCSFHTTEREKIKKTAKIKIA